MPKPINEEQLSIGCRVPLETKERMIEIAEKDGLTLSQLLRGILKIFLEANE